MSAEGAAEAVGLYVHVPFCHAKCHYCDFYSRGRVTGAAAEPYVSEAVREIEARTAGRRLRTVYLGGGTPSALPLPQLSRLLAAMPGVGEAREVTMEVNPEDVTADFCRWLRDSPVGRVSMGVQSLSDSELRAVGRRHTAAEAVAAMGRLRSEAGIANISLDLIYGLPGSTLDSWRRSLEGALALQPDHLSCYLLTYHEGTRLWARRQAGTVSEASPEEAEQMYRLLIDATRAAGLEHYEISSFARPGMRSVHNSSYWQSVPYIGIGPGAHSYDGGGRRSWHRADLAAYCRSWQATVEVEEETDAEQYNDFLLTRLRTCGGPTEAECTARFGAGRWQRLLAEAAPMVRRGVLTAEGGALRIPEEQWLIADSIIVELIQI